MRLTLLVLLLGCEWLSFGQRPHLSRKGSEDASALKTVQIKGVVMETKPSSVMVEAADHRMLTFKVNEATKYGNGASLSTLREGDQVDVAATQDDESFLTATSIMVDRSAPAQQQSSAASRPSLRGGNPNETAASARKAPESEVMKPAKPDPEDEGPPHLRYGKPDEKKVASRRVVQDDRVPVPPPVIASAKEREEESAPVRPVSVPAREALSPKQELIERARQEALGFTASLPNFLCAQYTTRYVTGPGSGGWQAKDVVSANVVYENGKEDYRNIQINGKAITKKMEEMSGSWSTGEFATTLRSLFHPSREADFKYVKQTQMNGMTAWAYDYSVKRERSDWRIQLGSQAIIPAYSGRVWIDSKTARTLRIEMQADDVPAEFPLDKIEATNDYGFVRLAANEEFLLPTHAENLSCERGTSICSRNAIDFRNYHKFSGDAVISFDK